jgi:hypothetical protein
VTLGTHDFAEVRGREPGPRTDVEHAAASSDPAPAPGGEHLRPPDQVLQLEPGDFFVVRPEHVIAVD